jgi:repressor LexA
MEASLTKAQERVFDAVRQFITENQYPPTLTELSHVLKIGVNAVRGHLLTLDRKQALRYVPNISRGIELPRPHPKDGIPLYGFVPAGYPFMSQENIVNTFVNVENYLSASGDLFGVVVRGESMKDANIFTDDVLFVNPHQEVRNGSMVVALVEGEPTVKYFEKNGEDVRLIPANKKFKPIEVRRTDENFKILGVVVGMMRAMDRKRIDAVTGYRKTA